MCVPHHYRNPLLEAESGITGRSRYTLFRHILSYFSKRSNLGKSDIVSSASAGRGRYLPRKRRGSMWGTFLHIPAIIRWRVQARLSDDIVEHLRGDWSVRGGFYHCNAGPSYWRPRPKKGARIQREPADSHCQTLEGQAHDLGVAVNHVQWTRTSIHLWRFYAGIRRDVKVKFIAINYMFVEKCLLSIKK